MNINDISSLTFPLPGASFGTLNNTVQVLGGLDQTKEQVFVLATRALEHYEGSLLDTPCSDCEECEDELDESAQAAYAGAVTAFRNGYAHHWIAALAEHVDEVLSENYLATSPRIRAFLERSAAIATEDNIEHTLPMHAWALAILSDGSEQFPAVSDEPHGGLLEASAGAAMIVAVASDLDESDAAEAADADVLAIRRARRRP